MSVVCVVVMVVCVASVAACVLVPRLAGATPYAVLTGSMRPSMPPGELVVVRPVEPRELQVGDVVTYQLRSGERPVVTHRVVQAATTVRGVPVLQTQGDANADPDPAWVRPVQLRGEVWYRLPHLGRLHTWLDREQHEALVRLAAGGLALHAVAMFAKAARGRARREATGVLGAA